jgi:hypothetical protein
MIEAHGPCSTTLSDVHPDHDGKLPIRLAVSPNGVSMHAEGYGDCGTAEGHGTPVFIELYRGELRVLVWANINREDPPHIISLAGAREDRRLPDEQQ